VPHSAGPVFDLGEGGLALALVRSMSVAALFSAFGALVFSSLIAPRAFARVPMKDAAVMERRLAQLIDASIALGVVALLLWLVLQSGTLVGAADLGDAVHAVSTVITRTAFGHIVVVQLIVLIAIVAVLGDGARRRRRNVATAVATVAIALQAGHSHAFAMQEGPSLLLASDVVHLLGAGAWLGGLLPLLLVVRMAPPHAGATACRFFSPLGKWCIAALVISAACQFWFLIGGVPGLLGTAYGWMVLAKAALFVVLLGFAIANRYRFAPALLGEEPAAARRILTRSIALQTCVGIAVVIAAGVLSSLPPAMHMPGEPGNEQMGLQVGTPSLEAGAVDVSHP
jgi:putative copper resistance protein D